MLIRSLLAVVLSGYAVFVWWLVGSMQSAGQQIDLSQAELAKPSLTPVAIIRFDGVRRGLIVPAWQFLNKDRDWVYVSSSSPISSDFTPELTPASVTTGSWIYDKRVRPKVSHALEELFSRASEANQPLIITSAYRSSYDQQDLYDSSVADFGQAWVSTHIALPSQSEHQTGLAVDLSSYSNACEVAFTGCDLRTDTAQWLADNAPEFGFILRYPKDKSHITGISHEPWHFRYVGKYMAKFVVDSGLTYDEIMIKLEQQKP